MTILTEDWNAFVDRVFRLRMLMQRGSDPGEWAHPWRTRVTWDPERAQWVAAVKAGFCETRTGAQIQVRAPVPAELASEATRERTGETSGTVDAWLSESPRLPLERFRGIGTGEVAAGETEAVPEFFADRGVVPATQLAEDVAGGLVAELGGLIDPSQQRLLRACDLVLSAERPVYRPTIDDDGRLAIELTGGASAGATLTAQRQRVDPVLAGTAVDGLLDEGRDTLTIATVYFLGPLGLRSGEVDSRWQAYVDHRICWNLDYQVRLGNLPVIADPTSLGNFGSLGGGQLGAVTGGLLDAVNAGNAELAALVSAAQTRGRFVTV